MIEQIIDGIWEDVKSHVTWINDRDGNIYSATKCRWRLIIRKAIAESQKKKAIPFAMGYEGGRRIGANIGKRRASRVSCSQAMLEETAVMDR